MRYYLAIIGTSAASLVVCVAIFMVFMALWPAHAQYFASPSEGGAGRNHGVVGAAVHTQKLWQLRDVGRPHGYVTEPGMPKCNPSISEECRRLFYSGKQPQKRNAPR
jgi:hypothetical protein